MDIIKTLSKVKLFHELEPESLIDLAVLLCKAFTNGASTL